MSCHCGKFLILKYLLVGLFYNPRGIFFNSLVLWAQDRNATRPLTNTEVSAGKRDQQHLFYSLFTRKVNCFELLHAEHLVLHFLSSCIKSLPFGRFHQAFVTDCEQSLSMILLHLVRDSTEETSHSCNTKTW